MRDTIVSIQRKAAPVLKKYDVMKAAVFGSVARGDFHSASDVDVLVDLPIGKTLLDLVALQRELSQVLGSDVDVVTYRSLHPFIKTRVLRDQQPIL